MRYGSLARRLFKIRWNLHRGLVQDHHVIPVKFRNHPIILTNKLDLNASSNLVMMPTYYGMATMNIRKDRLIHYGSHDKYNDFVKFNLDFIKSKDELLYFQNFLKRNCRDNVDNIPWN
jgi:hypothetical protein